jgi:hypothetical protein
VVTIRIPAPTSENVTNMLGAFSLLAIVVAVGLLTDFRWALLAAGVLGTALAIAAQNAAPARTGKVRQLDDARRKAG